MIEIRKRRRGDVPETLRRISSADVSKSSAFPNSSNPTILCNHNTIQNRISKRANLVRVLSAGKRVHKGVNRFYTRGRNPPEPKESHNKNAYLSFVTPSIKTITHGRTLMPNFSTSQGTFSTNTRRNRVSKYLGARA
jgi:hypothetical protein